MNRKEYICNQMYKQHALLRNSSWTDADKLEYMELSIEPYSKYWRWGMKKALKHAIKLLREEEAQADSKTEPKHGEWIDTKGGWKCTACDKWASFASDFCPNCGASMRERENEPQTKSDIT